MSPTSSPTNQEQLREFIEAKLEKGDAVDTDVTFGETEETQEGGDVVDLMEALRRSVEKNKNPAKKSASKGSAKKTTTKKKAKKSA